jgi:hypothetical protein
LYGFDEGREGREAERGLRAERRPMVRVTRRVKRKRMVRKVDELVGVVDDVEKSFDIQGGAFDFHFRFMPHG